MRRLFLQLVIVCVVVVVWLVFVASAWAVTGGPQWMVTAVSAPTNFVPGDESGDNFYRVIVENTGGTGSSGLVRISDVLPVGLTLDGTGVKGFVLGGRGREKELVTPLSCEGLTCVYKEEVAPEETLLVTIPVDVAEAMVPSCAVPAGAVSCATNVVQVSGGGAPDARMETPTVISDEHAGLELPRFGGHG